MLKLKVRDVFFKLQNVLKSQIFNILGSDKIELEPIDWHVDFKSGYRWHPGKFYKDYIQVNEYWLRENYTGIAFEFLQEMIAAMKGPDFFDHSDSMTDYFHLSHYVDLNIGTWIKPYVFTA